MLLDFFCLHQKMHEKMHVGVDFLVKQIFILMKQFISLLLLMMTNIVTNMSFSKLLYVICSQLHLQRIVFIVLH